MLAPNAMIVLKIAIACAVLYLIVTLLFTWLVQKFPRNPVVDPPDWGRIVDTRIPAADGGELEVWRIDPDGVSRGVVVFMHGWGRNRDRMVGRARIFGRMGFTAVIPSARDHGRSSGCRFMNAVKFAEDIESVLSRLDRPVLLYGHSAGAAAAAIAASRCPHAVQALFLEACYPYTREALLSLYRWVNPLFGRFFGPMILFWMTVFYRTDLDAFSPARLAPQIKVPVMLVHGKEDRRFPVVFAERLHRHFDPAQVRLFIAPGAGHSDSSRTPGYAKAVKQFIEERVKPGEH